jgi:ubiquinone/menaquinone biosynthesis C-methylase UbiE
LERLEQQHRALTDQIFRDLPEPLFLAPVREPTRILDCGHGSGAWVVEVAESYSDCEVMFFSSKGMGNADSTQVIGIDFSPIMNPDDIPENLHLQVRVISLPRCFVALKTGKL